VASAAAATRIAADFAINRSLTMFAQPLADLPKAKLTLDRQGVTASPIDAPYD
jgi:hypothetical protein